MVSEGEGGSVLVVLWWDRLGSQEGLAGDR